MDYKEYRKKYGAGAQTSDPKPASEKENEKRQVPEDKHGPIVGQSATGSVTRFFAAEKINKKRYSTQNKNSVSAKIVMGAIIAMTVLLIMVTVLLLVTSDDLWLPDCLAGDVTIEAGRKSIKASDFLVEPGHTAEFVDEASISLTKVGIQKVKIRIDGEKAYTTKLIVRDTVAPEGSPANVTVREGTTPNPSLLVKDIKDATAVTVSYQTKPDFSKVGTYSVTVILTDDGGNEALVTSTVTVVEAAAVLNYSVTVEAGDPVPDISAFVGADGYGEFYTDMSTVNTSVLNTYSVEINVAGQRYSVQIVVQDTIAPTATVSPRILYNDGDFPDPASFVSNINDETKVTVSYNKTPVKTGKYPIDVSIRLTDAGGNSTVYNTYVTAATDYTKPVITLLSDTIEIDAGETPAISSAKVTASDNSGEAPKLTLDTSTAELTVAGTYYVEYVAVDAAGNEARAVVKLIIHDNTVTDEMLEAAVETLCNKIMTPGMTTLQKMSALYTYLSANRSDQVHYANDSPHDDWRREAYLSLTTRPRGDCFAFAAIAKAVFSYLGFDTVMIQRSEECNEHGTHFWIMINIGDENSPLWYHFDATPMRGEVRIPSYGLTTDQLRAYTLWRNSVLNDDTENYYVYDVSLYPTSGKTIINKIDAVPSKFYSQKGAQSYFY